MAANTSYSHGIEQFEEVETEFFKQPFRGTMLWLQFGPFIVSQLCGTEYIIYASAYIQGVINLLRMTFIGQLQLVLQVVEAVVNRSSRQHQHLGLDTCTDHLLHQLLVAVGFTWLNQLHIVIQFLVIHVATIAEIVALVYDNEVVVAPVDAFEVDTCRHTTLTA